MHMLKSSHSESHSGCLLGGPRRSLGESWDVLGRPRKEEVLGSLGELARLARPARLTAQLPELLRPVS